MKANIQVHSSAKALKAKLPSACILPLQILPFTGFWPSSHKLLSVFYLEIFTCFQQEGTQSRYLVLHSAGAFWKSLAHILMNFINLHMLSKYMYYFIIKKI